MFRSATHKQEEMETVPLDRHVYTGEERRCWPHIPRARSVVVCVVCLTTLSLAATLLAVLFGSDFRDSLSCRGELFTGGFEHIVCIDSDLGMVTKRLRRRVLWTFSDPRLSYTPRQLMNGYRSCCPELSVPLHIDAEGTSYWAYHQSSRDNTPNVTHNYNVLARLQECAVENGDIIYDLNERNVLVKADGRIQVVDASLFSAVLVFDDAGSVVRGFPNLRGDASHMRRVAEISPMTGAAIKSPSHA